MEDQGDISLDDTDTGTSESGSGNHPFRKKLEDEVARAEAERREDSRTHPFRNHELVFCSLPFGTTLRLKHGAAIVSSQHWKQEQQDRASYKLCEKELYQKSLEEKARYLKSHIQKLAQELKDNEAGSTLTASLVWITQDDDGTKIGHILTAQIGDSRAILCTEGSVTRLTSEHKLHRKAGQDKLKAEGFSFTCNNQNMCVSVLKNNVHVALHLPPYTRVVNSDGSLGVGLQVVRTLGDRKFTQSECSVFRTHADLSYKAVTLRKDKKSYLVSFSDGIHDGLTDEQINQVFTGDSRHCLTSLSAKAQHIVCNAGQRSWDNLTLGAVCLDEIEVGQVASLNVADGHLGHHTAEHINNSFKSFSQEAEFPEPALKKKLNTLIQAVLDCNAHRTAFSNKYNAMRYVGQDILSREFISQNEFDNAFVNMAKNFFYISLQRNWIGFVNTTDSGWEIKRLLNSPGYKDLRDTLFPDKKNGELLYRDIRAFVTGDRGEKNKRKNERLFSGLNCGKVMSFWTEAHRDLSQDHTQAIINRVRPVR